MGTQKIGNPTNERGSRIRAYFLSLSAWYMMAAIIINDLAGKTVPPLGTAWAKKAS
nr:hypothetical protein [uncultured Draconibacterium sp.]